MFVVPTLQKKWNEIRMKELASGKCMENDCFLRTFKFKMKCRTNAFLFFILCDMSLNFLLENMYKTCVYMHFKIEKFVKICAKNI
jgi:hypothetical protein